MRLQKALPEGGDFFFFFGGGGGGGVRKLPFPSHFGKYFIKIGKISAKIHEIGKMKDIIGLGLPYKAVKSLEGVQH